MEFKKIKVKKNQQPEPIIIKEIKYLNKVKQEPVKKTKIKIVDKKVKIKVKKNRVIDKPIVKKIIYENPSAQMIDKLVNIKKSIKPKKQTATISTQTDEVVKPVKQIKVKPVKKSTKPKKQSDLSKEEKNKYASIIGEFYVLNDEVLKTNKPTKEQQKKYEKILDDYKNLMNDNFDMTIFGDLIEGGNLYLKI